MSVDEFSVTQCSDEEFDLALKSFSLEEVNVAIRIFEKQIEVEQRIQAGLQNLIKLYKAQPGMATKGTSVNKFMASTKQLVASQGRLAVLRSRSLRCVTRHIELGGHSFMNSGGQADGVHGDVGNNQSAINTGGSSGVSRKLKGLNRYYQPGVWRQKSDADESPDSRRKRSKDQPVMKQIRPVVVSVEVPSAGKHHVFTDAPKPIQRQRHPVPTATARAVGLSLGSTELTVYVRPQRHLRLHAREIPHTFNYIETESHVVQGREQPVAYRPISSPVMLNKQTSTSVSPHRVTAVVPSKFSPLPIKKKQPGVSQSVSVRKRALTLPSKFPRPTIARQENKMQNFFSQQPLPTHQTIYQIPPPRSRSIESAVEPPMVANEVHTLASEEEGEASSTVIIVPSRPPLPEKYMSELPATETLTDSHRPKSESCGEVSVHVGDKGGVKPKKRHPTKITIYGEKQEDPKGEFPVITPVEVLEDEQSPVEEVAADYMSESDEEPPPVPERPRGDYSVKINIDSNVPEMIHEPVPPPLVVSIVHAEWDLFEFRSPSPEGLHTLQVEALKDRVQLVQPDVDWNVALEDKDDDDYLPSPALSPDYVVEAEPPDHDLVSSPVHITMSPPVWPQIRSPEPSEQLPCPVNEDFVTMKLVSADEMSWGQSLVDFDDLNETDFALQHVAIHGDPTFPREVGASSPPPPDTPDIDINDLNEIDWPKQLNVVQHSSPSRKPVPVSVTLLRIIVSEPQKHANHIDYKVEFKSCLPCFPWEESVVRRRLQEFVWLRRKLKSPGVYVPLINGTLEKADELQDELQLFLRLVCSDPMHQYEESLHLFLKSPFPIPDAMLINQMEIEEMLLEEPDVDQEDALSSSHECSPETFGEGSKWYQMPQYDSIEMQLTALENLRPLEDGDSEVAGLGKFTTIASGRLPEKDETVGVEGDVRVRKASILEVMAVAPPPSVQAWLEDMEMEQYIPRFLDYGYDAIWVCAHLDDDDLVQLGIINPGDRAKLLANANLWKYRLEPADIKTPRGKDSSFSFDLSSSKEADLSLMSNFESTDSSNADMVVNQSSAAIRSRSASTAASVCTDPSSELLESPSLDFPIMRSASASATTGSGIGPVSYDTLTRHYLKITTEKHGIDTDYGRRGLRVRNRGRVAIYGTLPRVKQETADKRQLNKLDESRHDFMRVKSWDPSALLGELYNDTREAPRAVTEPLKHVAMNRSKGNVRMAGYLEKLPLNQKKPSFIHGWKKRYFKATDGNLFYFDDNKSEKAVGFIKLAGSKIAAAGQKQIQITERRGKFMLLRTQTTREAEDWVQVLESESVVNLSDQRKFLNLRAVIIDLGSSSLRAGIAYDDAYPQLFLPHVIAVDKRESATRKFGIKALRPDVRDLCDVYYPFRSSAGVDKKTRANAQDLICMFEDVFCQLQIDPRQFKVIISYSQFTTQRAKELIMNVLFEHFGVQGIYMQEQSVLSMYSYHETTGVMVDIGDRMDIVPVVEGYVVESGVTRLPYGGNTLTDHLMRLLTESGYRYFSDVESYITRYVKEKASLVALSYETTLSAVEANPQRYTAAVEVGHLDLPDKSQTISLSSARFRTSEGLFQPRLLGKDNPGIHELVQKAVQACAVDTRKELYRNIFLSGGTTKLRGFAERLEKELCALVPSSVLIQVHAGPYRQHAAFMGASVAASLSNFDEMCVWQDDWLKNGPESMQKWSLY